MAMGMQHYVGRAVATKIVAADGTGDFTDIQSAINALPSTGGVVYIKEGTYVITSMITINKAKVTIKGAGASTIISWNGSFEAINVTNYNKFAIYDVYFDGTNKTIGYNYGIYFSNSEDGLVNNCQFINCEIALVYVDVSVKNIVTNCNFNTCNTGIYNYLCINLTYNSNVFYECETGAYIEFSGNVQLIGNVFDSSIDIDLYIINTRGGSIIGNQSLQSGGYGFLFYNNTHNLSIIGNNIDSPKKNGIYNYAGQNSVISDNTITDAGEDSGQLWSGIKIRGDYNTVNGNRIRDSTNYEIEIYSGIKNIITSNQLLGTHTGALQDNGTSTQIGHNITA